METEKQQAVKFTEVNGRSIEKVWEIGRMKSEGRWRWREHSVHRNNNSAAIFYSITLTIYKNKQHQRDFCSFKIIIRKSAGMLLCTWFPTTTSEWAVQFQPSLSKKGKGIQNILACFYVTSQLHRERDLAKVETSVIRHEKIHTKQIHEEKKNKPPFISLLKELFLK